MDEELSGTRFEQKQFKTKVPRHQAKVHLKRKRMNIVRFQC